MQGAADFGPAWARVLVVGASYWEHAMCFRVAAALEPYRDYPGVSDEIEQLRREGARLRSRWMADGEALGAGR